MNRLESLYTEIARIHLSIPTLECRKSDSLDFHSVSVWAVRTALEAAFTSGAGRNPRPPSPATLPTPFDDYEIHGVAEFSNEDGTRYCEQVPDDEAQFWSLYGHAPDCHWLCIGNFRTRQFAEELYARITGQAYGQ